jgi:hypothetical protein
MQQSKPKSIAARWNPGGNTSNNNDAVGDTKPSWMKKEKKPVTVTPSPSSPSVTSKRGLFKREKSDRASVPSSPFKQLSWRKKKLSTTTATNNTSEAPTQSSPLKKALSWRKKKDPAPESQIPKAPSTAKKGNDSEEGITLTKSDSKRLTPRTSWLGVQGKLTNKNGLKKAPVLDRPQVESNKGMDNSLALSAQKKKIATEGDPGEVLLNVVMSKVKNKMLEAQARTFVKRIQDAGGFPQRRRLSIRDNDLVTNFEKVVLNDPTVTKIVIDNDPRFGHLKNSVSTLLAMRLHF